MALEAAKVNWPYERTWRCYDPFKSFLSALGFTVYPIEFDCVNSKHPLVDIAAKMGPFYWAFEYKSQNDNVSRGLDQLQCYAEWFDYVVLVSEHIFDHRSSENYWHLKHLGAGIWFYHPEQDKCIQKCNPEIQSPSARNRSVIARRFTRLSLVKHRLAIKEGLDQRLDFWAFVS